MTSGSIPLSLRGQLERETRDVHDFISGWFRGDVPNQDELFEQKLAARFAPELINIQPSGRVLTRAQLLASIRTGYGSNGDFAISIDNFECRQYWTAQSLVLATYIETQTGARKTTPPENQRISTVLFDMAGNGLHPLWRHIHETGLTAPNR